MASPSAAVAALPNGHPSTPPPSDTAPPPQPSATAQPPPSQPQHPQPPPPPPSQQPQPDPETPLTALQTSDTAKKPRDMKLVHLVLHSRGIPSYQERVPLQLLDFAYRYTSSTLSDALRLSAEGYAGAPERPGGARGRGGGGGGGGSADAGGEGITVQSLRQAIASRGGETAWKGHLPKDFMLEQAVERNRQGLPRVGREYGVALPPEKYCLVGSAWNLAEEWDSEEEGEEVREGLANGVGSGGEEVGTRKTDGDEKMGGMTEEDEGEEDEEGAGRMEDVFGDDGGETRMEE